MSEKMADVIPLSGMLSFAPSQWLRQQSIDLLARWERFGNNPGAFDVLHLEKLRFDTQALKRALIAGELRRLEALQGRTVEAIASLKTGDFSQMRVALDRVRAVLKDERI